MSKLHKTRSHSNFWEKKNLSILLLNVSTIIIHHIINSSLSCRVRRYLGKSKLLMLERVLQVDRSLWQR